MWCSASFRSHLVLVLVLPYLFLSLLSLPSYLFSPLFLPTSLDLSPPHTHILNCLCISPSLPLFRPFTLYPPPSLPLPLFLLPSAAFTHLYPSSTLLLPPSFLLAFSTTSLIRFEVFPSPSVDTRRRRYFRFSLDTNPTDFYLPFFPSISFLRIGFPHVTLFCPASIV